METESFPEFYDGPGLYKWIKTHYPSCHKALNETQARRLNNWANGERATFNTVDQILIRLDSHLDLIPEGLARESRPPSRANPITEKERAEIVRRYRAGESAEALANEANRSPSSIHKWHRQAPGYKPRDPTKDKLRLSCASCGKTFYRPRRRVKDPHANYYCSVRCSHRGRRPGSISS